MSGHQHAVDCDEEFCEDWESEPSCDDSDTGEHEWTSEGCGGLEENPGVWSVGGTSLCFKSRCRNCGMGRHELHRGSQRNPGECDTRRFEAHEYEAEVAP